MLIDHSPVITGVAAVLVLLFAMVWPNIQLKLDVKRREKEEQPCSASSPDQHA